MELIALILCQSLFNMLNSILDAYLIFKNKTIAHGVNFTLYVIVVSFGIFASNFTHIFIIYFF